MDELLQALAQKPMDIVGPCRRLHRPRWWVTGALAQASRNGWLESERPLTFANPVRLWSLTPLGAWAARTPVRPEPDRR